MLYFEINKFLKSIDNSVFLEFYYICLVLINNNFFKILEHQKLDLHTFQDRDLIELLKVKFNFFNKKISNCYISELYLILITLKYIQILEHLNQDPSTASGQD